MGNLIRKAEEKELQEWAEHNPWFAARGITPERWQALKEVLYPDAPDNIIQLAIDYCRARNLDIMAQPVHLVPFKGKYKILLGIESYRDKAHKTGLYVGKDAPVYGEWDSITIKGQTFHFPSFCTITVYREVNGKSCPFTATEFWLDNVKYDKNGFPTDFWRSRAAPQLAKCTEAQALRMAFPSEVGALPAYEEMQGIEPDGHYGRESTPYYEPEQQEYQPKDSFSQLEDFFEAEVIEDDKEDSDGSRN